MYKIYCFKCRMKRPVEHDKCTVSELKSNKFRIYGNCPECGCKVSSFIKKEDIQTHNEEQDSDLE